MTEYTVHDECDTNHVTAVLKDGKEQEQDRHLRNESKYCTKTTDDTIRYKAYQPVSNADTAESISYNTPGWFRRNCRFVQSVTMVPTVVTDT